MARYGSSGEPHSPRFEFQCTFTRSDVSRSVAAIVALGSPLAYVIATAQASGLQV